MLCLFIGFLREEEWPLSGGQAVSCRYNTILHQSSRLYLNLRSPAMYELSVGETLSQSSITNPQKGGSYKEPNFLIL